MNKAYLIIFVLSLTTISSCDKTGIANNIYEDKLIDQTNKELFFTSYFDVRKDSSLCNPYDSVSLVFIKKVSQKKAAKKPADVQDVKLQQK